MYLFVHLPISPFGKKSDRVTCILRITRWKFAQSRETNVPGDVSAPVINVVLEVLIGVEILRLADIFVDLLVGRRLPCEGGKRLRAQIENFLGHRETGGKIWGGVQT